ncbi:MAG: RNA polymerase subunit sigma-70, partial [Pedobacter sp.]
MNYTNLADEELLNLLKISDNRAYEEIYRRYWAVLFRHSRRMLSNDEAAKDLIQDLFVILWKNREEIT